ncbi:MAG: hypothetical protein BWY04_00080 [candidate division CPR1 bacterium ADurb.Bin160]|uniref:Uncharacterized protein n=1 Tax=candidate division CPR1 bacterium ADurb.Bin160 TaxID=1852826 RepID=A0A1V5ZS37_9BACT|nr:MAG: hypothetical protein BWY04_00080 [candidate division CPR1 bacterium ADurb.Bin160]
MLEKFFSLFLFHSLILLISIVSCCPYHKVSNAIVTSCSLKEFHISFFLVIKIFKAHSNSLTFQTTYFAIFSKKL